MSYKLPSILKEISILDNINIGKIINFAGTKRMRALWEAKAQPVTLCAVLKTPTSSGSQQQKIAVVGCNIKFGGGCRADHTLITQ